MVTNVRLTLVDIDILAQNPRKRPAPDHIPQKVAASLDHLPLVEPVLVILTHALMTDLVHALYLLLLVVRDHALLDATVILLIMLDITIPNRDHGRVLVVVPPGATALHSRVIEQETDRPPRPEDLDHDRLSPLVMFGLKT